MIEKDCVIIGAGSAGMAACKGLLSEGINDIVIIERQGQYGGILEQCIHNGFGLHTFKEELSGPAYAERVYHLLDGYNVEFRFNSTVTFISKDKVVTVQSEKGLEKIKAKAIIISTGCRERPAGAIGLKGDRPQGIYTAGTAQKYLNEEGYLVGKNIFILGSGDIGLIMARRMTLEGAHVIGVAEIMPYSNGLARNIKQCLTDFNIPLYLSHTVTRVEGYPRLTSITLSAVDEKLNVIEGSEQKFDVDCLLLSIGLIPEIGLLENIDIEVDRHTKSAMVNDRYMTSAEGIFACGNALQVHDLVDFVSKESEACGKCAAAYIKEEIHSTADIKSTPANGVGYVVPQSFSNDHDVEFSFRCNKVFKPATIHITGEGFEKTIKKQALVPSEMQKVILKKEELGKLKGKELFWEVI